jgi:hypothetical protein
VATNFESDNLPDEMPVEAIPSEFSTSFRNLLNTVLSNGDEIASEVKVARVHDRKGYMDFDALGRYPNSYSGDDLIIQMTVRIDRHEFETNNGLELEKLVNEKITSNKREAIEAREAAEMRELEEAAARATAALEAAKARKANQA